MLSELWLPYLSAFLVGLLGGVHCVGMCGGIVSSLTFGLPQNRQRQISGMIPFQLAYNLGRIGSYVVAGAIMGGMGMLLAQLMPINIAQRLLLVLAGIFMILLGLYLSGWWMILTRVEKIGSHLWQRLETDQQKTAAGQISQTGSGYRYYLGLDPLWAGLQHADHCRIFR